MTKTIYIILALLVFIACDKSEDINPTYYDCDLNFADSSSANPNNNKFRTLLSDITYNGVVGISMSVHTPENGMWMGASGKADLHNNVDMKACNISRVGSTVKTFTATTVLLLSEGRKIKFGR